MIRKALLILVLFLTVYVVPSIAQKEIKELPSGYFMTVAAYFSSGEEYARRYSDKLQGQGFTADYGFSYKKDMYFVYIKEYNDFQLAINDIAGTRRSTPFDDAWVYVYESINPLKATLPKEKEVEQSPSDSTTVVQDTAIVKIETKTIEEEDSEPAKEIDKSRIIFFEAVQARTQEPVEVEITLFDPYDEKIITTMKSYETKRISPPTNDKNIIRVQTNTFGWRKDAVSFDFVNPVQDSTDYFVKISNDTLVLFFDMHRLKMGDIEALYNVYFQSEAAIMRPASKLQLQELWQMMDESPKTKIKLHGHTNGNASGSYTRLGTSDTIFFKPSKLHEVVNGSAKKLSYDRAQTVKQYLVWQGIDTNRIEVKGWGGKKQIYDANSRAAQRNIRVEVEILSNND